MATPAAKKPLGAGEGGKAQPKRTSRERARTWSMVALGVLITLFAVLNLKQVRVDWIVGSGKAPLIIVIVISLLVGLALGRYGNRLPGRRE